MVKLQLSSGIIVQVRKMSSPLAQGSQDLPGSENKGRKCKNKIENNGCFWQEEQVEGERREGRERAVIRSKWGVGGLLLGS